MRRWIVAAASTVALVAALAAGPFGAAAAVPYVYGCTPAAYYAGTAYFAELAIYNGSASTATITHKLLAGTGALLAGLPTTSSLPATHTSVALFTVPAFTDPGEAVATTPAAVRIVSNVPVSATLSHGHQHDVSGSDTAIAIYCSPQQP
jgi:hypothetical protein